MIAPSIIVLWMTKLGIRLWCIFKWGLDWTLYNGQWVLKDAAGGLFYFFTGAQQRQSGRPDTIYPLNDLQPWPGRSARQGGSLGSIRQRGSIERYSEGGRENPSKYLDSFVRELGSPQQFILSCSES